MWQLNICRCNFRDRDEAAANVALEAKDDQNKSNDHHQISNNWKWKQKIVVMSEPPPRHRSVHNESYKEMNSKRIMNTVKLSLWAWFLLFVYHHAPGIRQSKHLSLEAVLSLSLISLLKCHQVTQLLLLKYPHGLFLPLYYLDFSVCKQWKLILATVIRREFIGGEKHKGSSRDLWQE